MLTWQTRGKAGFGAACALAAAFLVQPLAAQEQELLDLGLPPPSGRQNRVLPPPSGAQNPVLPPPSGQRYAPGVGGMWGEAPQARVSRQRRLLPAQHITGSIDEQTLPPASGAEVTRLSEIGPAIRRCWSAPALPAHVTGVMVTLRFSLRRDGSVIGQPRATWQSRRGDDPAVLERVRHSALAAIALCAPLRLSDALGQSIAGRPITIRFHVRMTSFEGPT